MRRAPLTRPQERALWEAVVSDSELGSAVIGSGGARWRRMRGRSRISGTWRRACGATPQRPTRAVFVSWASEYQRRVGAARATDQARLPDIVRDYIEVGRCCSARRSVVLAGFDETTPQQQTALRRAGQRAARSANGFEPMQHQGDAAARGVPGRRTTKMRGWPIGSRRDLRPIPPLASELSCRQLASRRRPLMAALDAALVPDRLLAPTSARPYTVSLGGALSDVALVAFFLRSTRLALVDVEFEQASADVALALLHRRIRRAPRARPG